MKRLTTNEAMNINAGKTYHCPFGCRKSGSFASVYAHCLANKCFTRNSYLKGLYYSGTGLIKIGKALMGFVK